MNDVTAVFHPRSIAIIGASHHKEKVGHQVLRNLKSAEAKYTLFPINPTSSTILGIKAFPDLSVVTEVIDVVIIATPAATVMKLIDQVIDRNLHADKNQKVKAVIVITAGFAELGQEGKEIQNIISAKLKLAGILLLGPNTLGILNPHTHLNASFAQHDIPQGNLGVISQSGAILTALFDAFQSEHCGISFAVSLGNKAGLNENDFLEYAEHDPHTEAILLYLESFTDLPIFFELASRISKKKPIIILKGGTSERGQQASGSHTAALATNQVLLKAAALQMGFTLVENLEEFVHVATFLAKHHQLPEHVLVMTNAGGPAVNTIDELAKANVALAEWSSTSLPELKDVLPNIPAHNPLDLLGDASPERFRLALQIAQRDVNIEAVVVLVTPQAMTDIPGIAEVLIQHKGRKPIFASFIGGEHLEKTRQHLRSQGIFCAPFPNEVVDVLKLMRKICQTKYKKDVFTPVKRMPAVNNPVAPNISTVFELLGQYHFRLPRYSLITQHNIESLSSLHYPLFAKTANLALLHKKQVGGVYGVVNTPSEAEKAFYALNKFSDEVLYQEVLEIEHEILLGAVNDPQFGLYMTIGLGGSYTNLIADRVYIFLPATKTQLKAAWMETKAFQAIKATPQLTDEVFANMVSMQTLLTEHPEVMSMEVNPLVVNQDGIWAADIKMLTQMVK